MNLEAEQMLEKERRFLEMQEQERIEQEKERSREKRENRRFWINTAISAVAAFGAVLTAIFTAISLFR